MNKNISGYHIVFHLVRAINIFCILFFYFLIFIGADFVASYFGFYFYSWVLIVLSIIEIGYVLNGDKELFKQHEKSNIFFIFLYLISLLSVLYHFIA